MNQQIVKGIIEQKYKKWDRCPVPVSAKWKGSTFLSCEVSSSGSLYDRNLGIPSFVWYFRYEKHALYDFTMQPLHPLK
ncbi:MAG: hypothetical protein M1496_02215 [Candidatus Thermoplasmatota archaeon]|nr:hypothetical protein [Candidatus Thermoplasmatota archaeon]